MISPDISPALIVIFVLLSYSPTMTLVFVYSQFGFKELKPLRKVISSLAVFTSSFFSLLLLHYFFKQSFEIYALCYTLVVTVLVIWNRKTLKEIKSK